MQSMDKEAFESSDLYLHLSFAPATCVPSCCRVVGRKVLVAQSHVTVWESMNCIPPGSSIYGIFFQERIWSGSSLPSSGDLPDPGIKPRSPVLPADSLSSEPWMNNLIHTKLNMVLKTVSVQQTMLSQKWK